MPAARPAPLCLVRPSRHRRRSYRDEVIPRAARLPLALLLAAALVTTGGAWLVRDHQVDHPADHQAGSSRVDLGLAGETDQGADAAAVDPLVANPDNPLRGARWGVYQGPAEMAWRPYTRAKGWFKAMLARIALAPKAKWFGSWIPDGEIEGKVRDYVTNAQAGDPDALVQLTFFRVSPWEQEACRRLPTAAEEASFRRWTEAFARGIGSANAAVVMQPDGPFQMCAPGGSEALKDMVGWATRTLEALPRTSVYIEVGSAGWNHLDTDEAVALLRGSGIDVARGFHMNVTHYEGTPRQIAFGAEVVDALAAAGYPGKHFTVDTAQNGRGFTWQYNKRHHPGPFDNAPTCRTPWQWHCVTLGIPPTADVTDPRWRIPARLLPDTARLVDGFLWSGRPWLEHQAKPFSWPRALAVARTAPFLR